MTLKHIFTIFMIQTSGTAQSDNKIQGGSTHHNNQVLINDGFTWMYCYTGYTFPESMRVLPAELFVRTAAKNCLEDDSLIGTTSATINFKSIAHKHPTSSQITKSITSRGLPAFWLLPSRKDQLYGTPNL